MTSQRTGGDGDYPFPQAAPLPGPALADGPASPAPSRSNVATTLVAVVCIVLAGVAVGWYLLRVDPKPKIQADSRPTAAVAPSVAGSPSPGSARVVQGRRVGAVALGVNYRSTAGHFVVNFSAQPVTERATRTGKWGFTAQLYMAQVPKDDLGVITYTLHPALTPGLMRAMQTNIVDGFLARYGGAGSAPVAARFRGRDALRARLVYRGVALTALSVRWSLDRGYLLLAPTGPRFAALTKSFHAID